jgi:hypothetical protein
MVAAQFPHRTTVGVRRLRVGLEMDP